MRRTVEIVGLNGNAAIGAVSVPLPMGFDYINLHFASADALVPADLTEIRETINSEPTRLYAGSDQEGMNTFDNLPTMATNNILSIMFEMVHMKSVKSSYACTRNTLSADPNTGKAISNINYRLVQGAAHSFRLFAEVDDATLGGPGGLSRVLKYSDSAPAGPGEYSSQKVVPFGSPERRYLRRVFSTLATATYSGDVRILRGNGQEEIFRRDVAVNAQIQAQNAYVRNGGALGPLGGSATFCIDSTETGISEMFDSMQNCSAGTPNAIQWQAANKAKGKMAQYACPYGLFDIRYVVSAADSITHLVEAVGRL